MAESDWLPPIRPVPCSVDTLRYVAAWMNLGD